MAETTTKSSSTSALPPSTQRATVGRILHAKSRNFKGVRAAMVTHVYDDGRVDVDLRMRPRESSLPPGEMESLPVLNAGDEPGDVLLWCEWPPRV